MEQTILTIHSINNVIRKPLRVYDYCLGVILTLNALRQIHLSNLGHETLAFGLGMLGVGLYDYFGHAHVDLGHVTSPITL